MKTLVIGASPNPIRYSYAAVEQLTWKGHEVIAIGGRPGIIAGVSIQTDWPEEIPDLDTITLYMGPQRQQPLLDRILGYDPRRIIFNPGTENPTLIQRSREAGIEVEIGCTLVMLAVGTYAATDPAV